MQRMDRAGCAARSRARRGDRAARRVAPFRPPSAEVSCGSRGEAGKSAPVPVPSDLRGRRRRGHRACAGPSPASAGLLAGTCVTRALSDDCPPPVSALSTLCCRESAGETPGAGTRTGCVRYGRGAPLSAALGDGFGNERVVTDHHRPIQHGPKPRQNKADLDGDGRIEHEFPLLHGRGRGFESRRLHQEPPGQSGCLRISRPARRMLS